MSITQFDDTTQWSVITRNLTLTSGQALAIRMSEAVAVSLRNLGFIDNLVISTTAPLDTTVLWLDTTSDPAILRIFNDGTTTWRPVVFADFFGRLAGATNLDAVATFNGVNLTSSSGTGTTVPLVTQSNAGVMSPADKIKLDTVSNGAEQNVQADWNQTDSGSDAFIRNKPVVGADLSVINQTGTSLTVASTTGTNVVLEAATASNAGLLSAAGNNKLANIEPGAEVNVQADWTEADVGSDAFIRNKPTTLGTNLSSVFTSTSFTVASDTGSDAIIPNASASQAGAFGAANFTKLEGIEPGAEVNVQADWNETDNSVDAFIRNKPVIQAAIQFMQDGANVVLGPAEVNFTGANVNLTVTDDRLNVDVTGGGGPGGTTNLTIARTANTVTVQSDTGLDGTINGASATEAGVMVSADRTKLDGIAPGAEANVPTDITIGSSATAVTVNSSTGASGTINAATATAAGVMDAATVTKVAGIAPGAEVNVQADWLVANPTSDAFIQNKPVVGADLTVSRTSSEVTVGSNTGSDAVIAAADSTNAGVLSSADKNKLDGIAPGAEVNAPTNISIARTANAVTVQSSTGSDSTINPATATLAGVMNSADAIKLASIQDNAQVNRAISSQAEAEAGVSNVVDMTPLRTAQAIAAQASIPANIRRSAIVAAFSGGDAAITVGLAGSVRVPFDGVITSSVLTAAQTGSIQIDIWKDTSANFPPTNADSITAARPPQISSGQFDDYSALTGWTTAVSTGDILFFNVDSVTDIVSVTLTLSITKNL